MSSGLFSEESEIFSIGMTVQPSNSVSSGISLLTQPEELPELPAIDELRLREAAASLHQRLVLRHWLARHGLQGYLTRLLAVGVTRLEDVYWLEDNKAKQIFNKDVFDWSTARESLPTSKADLDSLKADLWSEVVKTSNHQDAWTWGGMLVVSVSVAGLVTLAAMYLRPSLNPTAKHTLLQYVTGKYLHPADCKVNFQWNSPHPVGQTTCFSVTFYQRNGQPYPICDTDNFVVDITGGNRKLNVIIELGSSSDPNSANIAQVKFTVRYAGQYRVSVMVHEHHLAGSPFLTVFEAGPVYAQRTLVIRYCSTVVCTANVAHMLYIEPRDEYGNVCKYKADDSPTEGYSVQITSLGTASQENILNLEEKYSLVLDYDWGMSRVTVQLKFIKEGCYHATIKYKGTELHNGDFDIIVLNSLDSTLVQKNVASKNHNICYDAKLIGIRGDRLTKPKRVLCYVSPKQLIVKELILRFIPKRMFTFRLCPSTKFIFQAEMMKLTESGESFIIDDGCQPKIELISKERFVIAATFAQFLLKNMGGSETFKDKQDFFYHEVRKYHQKHYHERVPMDIRRDKLLESSMKATKSFSVTDWCKNFEVSFYGEQGIDWGGIRREWFELICAHLFDAKHELFASFHEGQQSLVHPNPNRPPHLKLKHYEFAGKVVGKCLYESALGGSYRQLVRARFTRSFLAQVIGLRVHYKYFEQDDPDLYLTKIKYLLDNNIDEIETEVYFVEEEYDDAGQLVKMIELLPNGAKIRVRDNTKLQYLDALAQYRLATKVKDELEAFLKGLNELIPDNLLSIFDENELELLLCGTGQYSAADLKAHHVLNGDSVEFRRVVGWFWAAIGNFTQEEMARLLQFVTGCSQLPPGGFAELTPKFQITAAPTFGNLPTAHTCFNQLCLPDYDSYEQFEKALLLAISEGTEGFGLV
ncbi:hypothetical protein ABEB36_004860 [Hypothenemus hampei]|uniref:HECT-type E3 ubiquitin transferase n=1 Tax=Hypothenemus hampei TaxID=57062 RepID=A0ABD1EW42_HYPHA